MLNFVLVYLLILGFDVFLFKFLSFYDDFNLFCHDLHSENYITDLETFFMFDSLLNLLLAWSY